MREGTDQFETGMVMDKEKRYLMPNPVMLRIPRLPASRAMNWPSRSGFGKKSHSTWPNELKPS
jgi:hypothetical protein